MMVASCIRSRKCIEERALILGGIALAVAACFSAGAARANPTNPVVVNGVASFAQAGNLLQITSTPNTIINWGSFSIGANEITRFIQQSSASAVLNRVSAGRDPSSILGALQSNGRVFLINPNGITFGAGSQINVAGLVASTLNLSDSDFLAGRMRFTDGLGNSVINNGNITTGTGGNVYLVGNAVTNNGIITSPKGDVILAAGNSVELVNPGTPDLRVEITAPENQAVNLGEIVAHSGRVGIYAGLINHSGTISANSVDVDAAGNITLRATKNIDLASTSLTTANGPAGGNITVQSGDTTLAAGTIEAKGNTGHGGNVNMLGNLVGLVGNATIDASGETGGGTVLIGGDYQGKNIAVQNAFRTYVGPDTLVKADAITGGNGGKVIVWSDDVTRAYGTISARGGAQFGDGGFVETSGKQYLDVTGIRVNANAFNGAAGKWLLDPNNLVIQTGGADTNINGFISGTQFFQTTDDSAILTTGSIQGALNGGTSVEISTLNAGTNSQQGNITINGPITKSAGGPASLTFTASNDINVNASITSTAGTLGLIFDAQKDINVNAGLSTNGGSVSFRAGLGGTGATTIGADINVGAGGISATAGTGIVNFSGAPTLTGAGTFFANVMNVAAGNNVTVNIDTSPDDLNMTGGTLGGSGRIEPFFNVAWSGGTIGGTGLFTIDGTSFSITGPVTLQRDMESYNGFDITGAGSINIASGATLTNRSGSFSTSVSGTVVSGAGTFVLDFGGSLDKSGAGTTVVSSLFRNDGSSGGVNVNAGVMQFTNGGVDTDGIYSVAAGATLQFSGGTRTMNNVSVSGAGAVKFDGAAVTLDSASTYAPTGLTTVSAGTVTFNQAAVSLASLQMAGGVVNGTANISVPGAFTWAGGTIGAGGTLASSGAGGVDITGAANLQRNWTASSGVNISGAGQVDIGSGSTLTIPAAQTMLVTSPGGTVVSGLGTLSLVEGNLDINSTGTVAVLPAVFNTTTQTGPSTVDIIAGTLKVGGGTDLGTTYTGAGGLEFFQGARTLTNNGAFNAAISTTGGPVNFSGATVTLQPTTTYNPVGMTTVSAGSVTFNQAGTIAFPALTVTGGALAGTAALSVSGAFNWSGGTMDSTGTLTTSSASNIAAGDNLNGAWINNGTANITGGALTANAVSGTGTVNHSGGATTIAGAYSPLNTTVSGGTLTFSGGATFNPTNATSITGGTLLFNNGSATFTGGLNLSAGTLGGTANLIVPGTSVFNWSGGTLASGGTLTTNGASTVSGLAPLMRNWTAVSPINITSAGILNLSGGAVSTPTLNVAGLLKGAGTITGNVNNTGTVAPGASPGSINIVGNYTQTSTGTLQIELGGTAAGSSFDQLTVSGNAALDGALVVTQFGSFVATPADTFNIITTGGTVSGAFSSVVVPFVFTGLSSSYQSQLVQLGGAVGIGATALDPRIVKEDKDIFAQTNEDTDIFKKLQDYQTCN
jgi:filamentous hemagglutinin family protein